MHRLVRLGRLEPRFPFLFKLPGPFAACAMMGAPFRERMPYARVSRPLTSPAAQRGVQAASRRAHGRARGAAAGSGEEGRGAGGAVRGLERRRQGQPHLRPHVQPGRARHERLRHRGPGRGGRPRLRGGRPGGDGLLPGHAGVLARARPARRHDVLRPRLVHGRHAAPAVHGVRRALAGRVGRRRRQGREEGRQEGRRRRGAGARRAAHRPLAPLPPLPTSSSSSWTTATWW